MLTVKMLSDKSLVMTKPTTLYQRQSLVDEMQILLPNVYDSVDLTPYDVTIEYIDPGNNAHMEQLVKDDELYQDKFIRCTMALDSKFTYIAGDVIMKLTLTHVDESEGKKYILKTGELVVTIQKLNDYFAYVDSDSISSIDQKIMELQAETDKLAAIAEIYGEKQPDDLVMSETALLQLSANGTALGNGVQLAEPVDEDDGKDDGVIDLDSEGGNDDDGIAVIDL